MPLSTRNNSAFVKLTYVTQVDLTKVTSYSGEWAFRTNSIYDPDYTGSGHQPYMHDQLSPLWTTYEVLGCKVRALFHARSANTGLTCYIRASDDATVATGNSASFLKESKSCLAWRDMRPCGTFVGGDIPQITLKTYINNRRIKHFPDRKDYMSSFGSNPGEDMFVIVGHAADGATDDGISCHVTLTYYVVVRGRKVQTSS